MGQSRKERAGRENEKKRQQKGLAYTARVGPAADQIGAERPGDGKPRADETDLRVVETQIVLDERDEDARRVAVEECDSEGDSEQQQQSILVAEDAALCLCHRKSPLSLRMLVGDLTLD